MSVGNGPAGFGEPDTGSGKAETAKQEASAVKDTATDAAKDVAHTAKDEVASVATEAKTQLKDLYSQSRTELSDQASQQQARIASGLKAVGEELGSMARNAEGGGVATDLVQQVSTRLSDAATWLGDRDPAALLDEVKRFARRRPVVFIAGAAIAGLVAGRLVRAMAANHQDDSTGSAPTGVASTTPPAPPAPPVPPLPPAPPASAPAAPAASAMTYGSGSTGSTTGNADDTPLYTESAAGIDGREGTDERRDTF